MEELIQLFAAADIEQKVTLLDNALAYGELGLDFLVEALSDPALIVRAKAYQLLKNELSQKAQQAISKGLLLNPGDRFYSVYQSAIWFDDEFYHIFDNCDSNNEIKEEQKWNSQIINNEKYDNELSISRRLSSHLYKFEAEAKAELIHQKILQKQSFSVGIGSYHWKKKLNPDFKLKDWCKRNKILYEEEWNYLDNWQIEDKITEQLWDSKNYELLSIFVMAKRGEIDLEIWGRENNIYNKIVWRSLNNFWDYLKQPENINLFSKFWKDGVGSFAYVCEEVAKKPIYLKI